MKIKEFIKKYMIGLTLSFLICIVSVSAITYFDSKNVTYNNETTGMTSTNVQEAVNELYNVCFPPKIGGDAILEDVEIVTTGDGLYADTYENGRYFYKGANPNNYITFNNEDAGWRIISIEADKTIKIMRDASIGNMAWDSSNSNNWARPASLNTYLNGSYLTGTLNQIAQNQIVAKNWSIGSVTWENNDLAGQITSENSSKWNGKIALPTVSEYIRTNSDNNCQSLNLYQKSYSTCKNTTWMYSEDIDYWLMLSPQSGDIARIFNGGTYGFISYAGYNANIQNPVRPSLYLSSEVKITGGDGSQSNPYTIG